MKVEVFDGPSYEVVSDDSGHDYVIPSARKLRWYIWCDSEEAELGAVPEWAERINGKLRFENYVID